MENKKIERGKKSQKIVTFSRFSSNEGFSNDLQKYLFPELREDYLLFR